MFIKILGEHVLGYVKIRIEGFFVERVMNKAIHRKIFFWNIKREKTTIVYANIGVNNFKEFSKLAKDNKCKIKIIKKYGMPFFINRYKKRKLFIYFCIILCLILFALSNFVWNIQIEGTEKIDKQELINELNLYGLKVGVLKQKVKEKDIINEIRLKREDISWIGIQIDGTNAIVKVVEADEKPKLVDDNDFCNIVSTKDAQIVKISAQNGVPVVKEGDIVNKGEILIAGWIEGKYTGTRYVHSNGEIQAKVWYSEKTEIPYKQIKTENTGNVENKYKIKINNFSINLYKTLTNFKKYDTIETYNKVKIFSNFYLPIEIIKLTNYEQQELEITYGAEEAKQIGIAQLSEKIKKQIIDKSKVLQKYTNAYANGDSEVIEVTYEVLENIGTKEKIVF